MNLGQARTGDARLRGVLRGIGGRQWRHAVPSARRSAHGRATTARHVPAGAPWCAAGTTTAPAESGALGGRVTHRGAPASRRVGACRTRGGALTSERMGETAFLVPPVLMHAVSFSPTRCAVLKRACIAAAAGLISPPAKEES
ncbi:hypothetical protein Airi01_099900 [Actinoallomurus iriomotensis]|uniref:Uncharacterized protein n=1 Tax=Actinoallomurus iriomotensis TaxID=478107 RepID=A0A9W6RU15_9ACTN|nr:hypothetical protein Airi01_099900 [Actinoallomurus iriomotensis]